MIRLQSTTKGRESDTLDREGTKTADPSVGPKEPSVFVKPEREQAVS